MSRDFYKGFRNRHAAPAFEKARQEQLAAQVFLVSPAGELREMTGAEYAAEKTRLYDWSWFDDRGRAEVVAANRIALAAGGGK